MKLSVIVPVYNEEGTIALLLEKVIGAKLPEGIEKEVIVIDDGSTDDSLRIIKGYAERGAVRLIHQSNAGKTSAVLKGMAVSTGEIILIQDADLEYDPAYYTNLITPIINGQCKVVYGSRFMGSVKNMRFSVRLANIMTNLTLNMIYGTKLTDNNTCYKVFKREVLDDITITSSHFGFDCEVTVKLLKKGTHICEVPIDYVARSREEGKKNAFVSSFSSYLQIFRYSLKK